ncbi:GAF domain-containing protein [Amycolatopsis sulphurea]|uniref:GAF domain-containing protein n=1 Tax=Amycolatopsis sulphurea TaxID=76022 RepID=A0A2A9G0N4_9PSEU|nr:GAF and ANTAR domain-containing protein [Amycolatopsis sulphurea]PFG57287.1 GAF domain-containing protein [Amycolatopsis sulphurea]
MEPETGTTIEYSVVVRLSGDCPGSCAELAALSASAPKVVIFELSGLTAFACEDLTMLRESAGAGRAVFACRPDGVARRVLEAEGVRVADSVAAALADEDDPLEPSGVAFRSLTERLLAAPSVGAVLQHIVDAAASLVPAADLVSITLLAPDGRFHTAAYTDPTAAELDRLQYELGEGPCHDAALPDRPEFIERADLRATGTWPDWAAVVAGLGWRSVLAIALTDDTVPRFSGALNLYARAPGGLAGADRDIVLLLASHAALAVAETDAVTRDELHQAQLRTALDSRDVIGQAKGILMARRGLDADAAFELLRRASQQLNVKLVQLAGTLARQHAELDVGAPEEPDPV